MAHSVPIDSVPIDAVMALLAAAADGRPDRAAAILTATGLPADVTAGIDAEIRRLTSSGDRWRRRGRELAALFSSARELAQLRDVDALLDRLVERAHDLLGTDVTYLSEYRPDSRELQVRTTVGTTSAAFRNLRVPPGMGLASMVAERRSPQWTANYAAMAQAPHEPGLDAAVAGEGLVSLLGVPLLAGDEVIGVLFAANRAEHTFTPEEIALLSAFADHAAVVLQTARLFAATRDSHTALAGHVEAMERASAVHEELTALVLRGGTATDVVDALGRALACRATILDPDAPVTDEVRAAIGTGRRTGRCVFLPFGPSAAARVVVAVMAGPTLLGALLLEQETLPFGPVEQRTAERAAQITALLSLKQDAIVEAEQRVRSDLVADLLATDPGRKRDLAARARARHVRLPELRTLVVLAVEPEHRRAALQAATRAAGPDALVGAHGDLVVALSTAAEPAAAVRAIHSGVRAALGGPVRAVAATPAAGVDEFRDRFAAAAACAVVLPALGMHDCAVTTDEYLPYAALFGPGEERVGAYVMATLGPVLEWDGTRGATLLPTLAAYIDNRMSPVGAARVLHVHKNTVLQRLDRITELLGNGWQQPEQLFRLSVAVRLAQLNSQLMDRSTIGTAGPPS